METMLKSVSPDRRVACSMAALAESAPPPPSAPPLPELMEQVARGLDLSGEMAAGFFSDLMDGLLSPAQAGAVLMGLRAKGETAVELAEAARAVLARATPLPPLPGPALDIVGTGGDGRHCFNCSTAAALTVAALGHKVVKHGNRSVSSRCGSADVLEKLGFRLDEAPEDLPSLLEERNFVFLFAPNHHPAFRHIMPIRREMGIRTLFNILGPLVNPARPARSLLGAASLETLPLLAEAQARLGTEFSAVVHGAGGYDEMTAIGPATVYLIEGAKAEKIVIDPADYGFPACAPRELAISGPDEGAAVLRDLLAGRGSKPMRDMLILNVAMALYVIRGGVSFDACLNEARRAVDGGAGQEMLKHVANA
jgi:anthranilate phosphoribosyltransferase